MNKGHRELVGLQVTFSKAVPQYNLTHYYRWSDNNELGPVLIMRGYDMERADPTQSILEGLFRAYGPAIRGIWKLETEGKSSAYMRFLEGGMPKQIQLDGDWKLWAKW